MNEFPSEAWMEANQRISDEWVNEKPKPVVFGGKEDNGKPELSLVPLNMLERIARVRTFGVKKYGDRDNWKTINNPEQRYFDAMLRHLTAHIDDPNKVDSESGLPHWDHFLCNISFLTYFMDNNPKKPEQLHHAKEMDSCVPSKTEQIYLDIYAEIERLRMRMSNLEHSIRELTQDEVEV